MLRWLWLYRGIFQRKSEERKKYNEEEININVIMCDYDSDTRAGWLWEQKCGFRKRRQRRPAKI